MNNDIPQNDFVAQLDQLGTGLENIAELMAIYYTSLKEKHIGDELAQKLVVDFNRSMWSQGKDTS
uniref:Uncharacterized protein n=1 Tax=viral metagenome TaxID=1070528 RepID=A0A6M3K992_9ZZZZ